MPITVVLIHSPLAGPLTWSRVAEELTRRQVASIVPILADNGERPFWEQHVESVIGSLQPVRDDAELVLVGHSGAGALLPAIGKAAGRPISAYIFVDSGIPTDGLSRLQLMATEDQEFAESLEHYLASGETFPSWTDEDLVEIVPDDSLRRQLLSDLRPRSLAFFSEPIPVFAGWPDADCGYLHLSSAYDKPAKRALEAGWHYVKISSGHFHLLLDPEAVASAVLTMIPSEAQRGTMH